MTQWNRWAGVGIVIALAGCGEDPPPTLGERADASPRGLVSIAISPKFGLGNHVVFQDPDDSVVLDQLVEATTPAVLAADVLPGGSVTLIRADGPAGELGAYTLVGVEPGDQFTLAAPIEPVVRTVTVTFAASVDPLTMKYDLLSSCGHERIPVTPSSTMVSLAGCADRTDLVLVAEAVAIEATGFIVARALTLSDGATVDLGGTYDPGRTVQVGFTGLEPGSLNDFGLDLQLGEGFVHFLIAGPMAGVYSLRVPTAPADAALVRTTFVNNAHNGFHRAHHDPAGSVFVEDAASWTFARPTDRFALSSDAGRFTWPQVGGGDGVVGAVGFLAQQAPDALRLVVGGTTASELRVPRLPAAYARYDAAPGDAPLRDLFAGGALVDSSAGFAGIAEALLEDNAPGIPIGQTFDFIHRETVSLP